MAQNDTHKDSSARQGGWLDWIERHPKTVWAVGILVVLTGVWFALEAAGKARLGRAMAAVRAKGEPLTLEDLQKQVPVIADDRNMALVLLAQGGAIHRGVESAEFREKAREFPLLGYAGSAIGVRLPPEQAKLAREFLRRHAAELSAIEAATTLGDGVYPTTWATPAIATLLPQLSIHRSANKALGLKAMLASEEGQTAEATADLSAMAAMDAAMRHESTLIGMLVRNACEAMTCSVMLRCVALAPFSDAELKRLDESIVGMGKAPGLHDGLLAERAIALNTMLWAYGGGNLVGVVGGGAPPGAVLRWIPSLKGIDPALYLELMSKICDAARLPPAESVAAMGAIESKSGQLPFYAVTARILLPSLSRSVALWHRAKAITRATRVAIAAERYRLKRGAWPVRIEELAPEYLPDEALVDPFSGKPLVYHRDRDGIRLYSVGEDGFDDGGVMDRERTTTGRTAFDPGVYLPNPELRNRATATQPVGQ